MLSRNGNNVKKTIANFTLENLEEKSARKHYNSVTLFVIPTTATRAKR